MRPFGQQQYRLQTALQQHICITHAICLCCNCLSCNLGSIASHDRSSCITVCVYSLVQSSCAQVTDRVIAAGASEGIVEHGEAVSDPTGRAELFQLLEAGLHDGAAQDVSQPANS